MEQKYIGDGVYVGFDGYHVTIAVNHHENIVAYFEPEIMINLIDYWNQLLIKLQEKNV